VTFGAYSSSSSLLPRRKLVRTMVTRFLSFTSKACALCCIHVFCEGGLLSSLVSASALQTPLSRLHRAETQFTSLSERQRSVTMAALITGPMTASVEACSRRRNMVLFIQFIICPISHASITLIIPHPGALSLSFMKYESEWIQLILSHISSPGVLLVRLGLLPPVVMLPVNVQLHGEPAGLLLPAAARDPGVRHHDSPRHGGVSETGTLYYILFIWMVHTGLLHQAPF